MGVVRSVAWNVIGMVAVSLTMLITIPLFLRFFGAERYGILATVWVFFGYFSILDFGMGPAVVNMLSKPDRGHGRAASGVFWTACIMNLAVGMVLGGVLFVGFLTAGSLGAFSPGPIREELFDALPWLLVMMPVSLIYPILVGALDARRLFGLANANQVTATVLGQALPLVAIAVVEPTLNVAIAGSVLGRVASAIALLVFCVRKLELTAPRFEWPLVRELMSFGGWVALSSSVGLILDTADRMVIASVLGGASAAWYAISYNLVTRARVLPHAIARVLYQRVSADPQGNTHLLAGGARVMTLILIPALAIGMVLIDPLCRLWIGAQAAETVLPVARIMLLGIYANCIAYIPLIALQARGDPDRLARIHLIQMPFFLLGMYLATRHFGTTGAAIAWSARLLLDAVILLWVTDLKRVLFVDTLLYLLVLVLSFAIAVLLAAGWWIQAVLVLTVLLAWALADTLGTAWSEDRVSFVTLYAWLKARMPRSKLEGAS